MYAYKTDFYVLSIADLSRKTWEVQKQQELFGGRYSV
jgi:hypothetical protein